MDVALPDRPPRWAASPGGPWPTPGGWTSPGGPSPARSCGPRWPSPWSTASGSTSSTCGRGPTPCWPQPRCAGWPGPWPSPIPSPPCSPGRSAARRASWRPSTASGAWADHGDLAGPWVVVTADGRARAAAPEPRPRNRTLGPFVEHLAPGDDRPGWGPGARRLLVARLLEDPREPSRRPTPWRSTTSATGGSSAGRSPNSKACSSTWPTRRWPCGACASSPATPACRAADLGPGALVDVLALRTFALESARSVLSTSHLLHGAVGFCDEHDLSVVTGSVQSSLRLPTDLARTGELLRRGDRPARVRWAVRTGAARRRGRAG